MKKIDDYNIRLEMVDMHRTYINNLKKSFDSKNYIETPKMCYTIFEQRINRLIEKNVQYCPKEKKEKGRPASISARINCIINLIENKYNGLNNLNKELFDDILKWCDKRNNLVHDLVKIDRYKTYDSEFYELAVNGINLVQIMYEEISKYRKIWYDLPEPIVSFPKFKCNCNKRCIYEKEKI